MKEQRQKQTIWIMSIITRSRCCNHITNWHSWFLLLHDLTGTTRSRQWTWYNLPGWSWWELFRLSIREFEEKTTEIGITVCDPETTTVSAFWRVGSAWLDGVSREWHGNIVSRSWKKNDSTTSLTGPWSEGDRKRMIRKDIEGIASRIRGITRRAVLKDKSYC